MPLDSCPSLLWPLFVTRVDQLVNPGERCWVTAKETPANTKHPQNRPGKVRRPVFGEGHGSTSLPFLGARGPQGTHRTHRKDSDLGSASVPLSRDLGWFQHHTLREVLGPGRNSPHPGKSSGARTCQPGHRPLAPGPCLLARRGPQVRSFRLQPVLEPLKRL